MITELRTLAAVVQYGGFSAAGDHIGLTQSAVSSQIQRLENSIGFKLFDRTRRSAVLNDAGARVLERAQAILALYARLADDAPDGQAAAALRIGAIASVQSTLLPRALARLRTTRPLLRLNIVPGVSLGLMDQLDSDDIEAAVMIRPPFGILPEMVWHTLAREPFKLLVPAAMKGRNWRSMLRSQPFFRYDRTSFGGRLVTTFLRDNGLVVEEAIELDEISGLINLVAEGQGVALAPMAEAYLPLPARVRAVSLGESSFYREIGLLRKKRPSQPELIQALEQSIRETLPRGGALTK
ncbi:MAG: LysR substrate-binding domain-containing protein [Pseudomonadota bacterium]